MRVEYVYDGDTFGIDRGQSVRLIGINTPEIGRDGEPSEPHAEQARRALKGLAREGGLLHLRLGAEPRDRYGRILAHAFLPDGTNVTEVLLEGGAGAHITISPNLWGRECYREAEKAARRAERGVWETVLYRARPSDSLDPSTRGFRVVEGRVTRTGSSRSAFWINLEGNFALRIPRRDLPHFPAESELKGLPGKRVQARGWIYKQRGELRMAVRHPDAIEVLPP